MEGTRQDEVSEQDEAWDGPLVRRRRWWWVPGAVLLVAFLAFVFSRHSEEQQFLRLLRAARPVWLLVALGLQLATYLCVAGIWHIVLGRTGVRVSVWSLSRLSVMKLAFDQVIPTAGIGGTLVVARGLRREGAAPGVAAGAVLLTVLCFYAAQALGVGASIVFLWARSELSPLVQMLVTAFGALAIVVPVLILGLSRRRNWKPGRWLRRVPGLEALVKALAEVPPGLLGSPSLLVRGIALQLSVYVLDAATLGAMLRALGQQEVPPSTVFVSFMVASMAETVSIIPGGVGTYEAVSVGMLNFMGVPVEVSLAGTLLLRGFTLWLPMVPGLYLLRRTFTTHPPEMRTPTEAGSPPGMEKQPD
ncbi:flippase-like domain-containing protein [Myxococcaceae bacterium JPH2]|nr:flippase-like domain-containing protein [Myxococcaceae bacterium JPH2]